MAIELLIRDGTPDWWESPDIWVVPGTDPNGAPGTPVVGKPAYLWAAVTNQGDQDAAQVQVGFWVADPSLQIRKSTAHHIGTAFADVPAGTSQEVLCLVPWNVTLVNDGHECVVAEASSSADPLVPPAADPDVLDAPTYRQIAQRNLSVVSVVGHARHEVLIGVHAGARVAKAVEVQVETGRELSKQSLESLGLRVSRNVGAEKIGATLSEWSLCAAPDREERESMRLHVAPGTSEAVYLTVGARDRLTADEYAVVRVVERAQGRAVGGLSVVVVDVEQKGGDR